MISVSKRTVLIVQKSLPHYRVTFFNLLKEVLAAENIELTLVYGGAVGKEVLRGDEGVVSWALYRPNISIGVFGRGRLIWQRCFFDVLGKDLVIVEQANSLLLNYVLMVMSRLLGFRLAFWGHGLNRQANPTGIANRFKRLFLMRVDCWFAYTQGVKRYLISCGVDDDVVTSVSNSIDVRSLEEDYQSISPKDVEKAKDEVGISGDNVAIFCGGIYSEKQIDMLIESAILVRREISDFHLIVLGSGPDAWIVEKAASDFDWIHLLGPKFGREKAMYFKLSRLFLMPGLVGLSILDSFATRTPMITTDYAYHSPEIEYLEDGVNGLVISGGVGHYASGVIECLRDKEKLATLIKGCEMSSARYSIENMVDKFSKGILRCLGGA